MSPEARERVLAQRAKWQKEHERAIARREATAYRKCPMPVFPAAQRGPGWCRWCGQQILHEKGKQKGQPNTRRTWHPGCVVDFKEHNELPYQFDACVARSGHRCAHCQDYSGHWSQSTASTWRGDDETRWGYPRWVTNQKLPLIGQTGFRVGDCCHTSWVTSLEVDHVIPLYSVRGLPDEERRRFYGPANLQLLCPAHHKAKTRRETQERAAERRFVAAQLLLI